MSRDRELEALADLVQDRLWEMGSPTHLDTVLRVLGAFADLAVECPEDPLAPLLLERITQCGFARSKSVDIEEQSR